MRQPGGFRRVLAARRLALLCLTFPVALEPVLAFISVLAFMLGGTVATLQPVEPVAGILAALLLAALRSVRCRPVRFQLVRFRPAPRFAEGFSTRFSARLTIGLSTGFTTGLAKGWLRRPALRARLADGRPFVFARRAWLAWPPFVATAVAAGITPQCLAARMAQLTPAATPFRGHALGPEILNHIAFAVHNRHTLANLAQHRRQLFLIGDAADRHGRPDLASAAGAADPVDVGLNGLRQVEIHHHAKTRDIDAARRHVSGDKNLQLATLKPAEHLLTDRLAHVAMKHVSVQPLFAKPVGKILGAHPGARED